MKNKHKKLRTHSTSLLDRVSIRRKLIGAFIVVLSLFVAATVAAFWFARSLDDARMIIDHTYEVLVEVGTLRSGMWAQESGLRGYVITGDERFFDPYRQGSGDFDKALRRLQRLTSDSPAQQTRLSQIKALENRWQNEIVASELELLQQGNVEQAQQVIAGGEGKVLLDGIRDLFGEVALAETQLLAMREGHYAQTRQEAVLALVGLLGLALLLGLLAMFGVSRQVTQPLAEITTQMRRIAEGELNVQVPYQGRADEVGEIARALEHFRQVSKTNEATSWVRKNLNTLRLSAQKARTETELAQSLLQQLAPMVEARYAALFVRDEHSERYQLLAGYGYSANAGTPASFGEGEGLVGQCAQQRAPIVLSDAPVGYVQVASGLGRAKPNHLILAPAVYDETSYAVLELALFGPYLERHARLVEELLPTTALSLATLQRHERTQELLKETHAQSEELQASEEELRSQQDVLRQTNEDLRASQEELKAQSDQVQASNEELRLKSDLLESQKQELQTTQKALQDKATALEQASQYKSEFLANMSHELRTPLNSLLILARSLAENENGHLDNDEVEAAKIVHESGTNLLRLINDILDLSKVESGKMQVYIERLPLAAFRERLLRNFAHVAQEKQLEYAVTLAPDLPEVVQTDPGKLEQIVNNLLANAFKFTPEGEVRVTLSRPPADMVLRSPQLRADTALCIAVIDQGIGIAEDKREKIFQAFEQVDSSTSRVYGGTGLGLSISQRMAALLGGEVHLKSAPGQGSTFSLVIPQAAAQSQTAPLPEVAPTPPKMGVTTSIVQTRPVTDDRDAMTAGEPSVLIIEDDAVFAQVLRDEARRAGYKCLLAADGESGLVLAEAHRPTGIVLDIGLPGIDGWTVLERLKAQPGTGKIPVHILSGADDTGRGQRLGAIGYLPKPATRKGLQSMFARVLAVSGGARKRLLVVDDDAGARAAVKTLLKSEDIDVRYAETAASALTALDSDRHDCVVLDLNLPDMSGFELIEKINALGDPPPVIVYSARELSDEENLRLRSQTDSIVVKGVHAHKRLLDEVTLFMHSIRGPVREISAPARVVDTELSGKTVLLVDDDMRNTFALSRVLRARGLKVLMAQDGLKALKQLEQQPEIDIVLMDIMMPAMDGYETMRRIRAQTRFEKLPMLALTAKAMQGDREKCIAAGANDYLSKPIDTDKLLSMMRAWMPG